MLWHIRPGLSFKLQTDASNRGIAGILFQEDTDGEKYVISMVSRCLSRAEQNYSTTEKELLAIVYAVIRLRTYLIGVKFEIITDHKALIFLNNSSLQSPRLIRWSMALQPYDYTVRYCKGTDNTIADFFSRHPDGKFANVEEEIITISAITSTASERLKVLTNECSEIQTVVSNLAKLQEADSNVNRLRDRVMRGLLGSRFCIFQQILFSEDKISGRWRIVVPTSLTRTIIEHNHRKLVHPGAYKTFAYMKQYYYWHGMRNQIKKFVKECDLCQRIKPLNVCMQGPYQMVKSEKPGDLVTVDFYGPLPRSVGRCQYLFVVLDAFTKYVKLYPLPRATTDGALRALIRKYISECGQPCRVLSDHGTQFTSPKWQKELKDRGIQVIFSSIRHPQSNPTERVMRELGRHFRALCSSSHAGWMKVVPIIEQLLNVTLHSSTGYTPLELQFGEQPVDEINTLVEFPPARQGVPVQRKRVLAFARMKEKFQGRRAQQRNVSSVVLKEGDLVLVRVPQISKACDKIVGKFNHLYYGPYRIVRDLGNNSYEIVQTEGNSLPVIYNRTSLRKYYCPKRELI